MLCIFAPLREKSSPNRFAGPKPLFIGCITVVDHVAFSVADVNATVSRLRAEGVKILEPLKTISGGRFKDAFIEGPDYIRIELVATDDTD